jgi:hypothetical protein
MQQPALWSWAHRALQVTHIGGIQQDDVGQSGNSFLLPETPPLNPGEISNLADTTVPQHGYKMPDVSLSFAEQIPEELNAHSLLPGAQSMKYRAYRERQGEEKFF